MDAPDINPARRPTRRIHIDAGIVQSAVPTTNVVIGSVASALSGAKEKPTRPLSAIRMMLPVNSSA